MQAQVLEKVWKSDDIFSLRLKTPSTLQAKPGQFVMVTLSGFPQRAYSIVEEKDATILLGIKMQQGTSKALSRLQGGETLDLIGPFGSFIPREGEQVTLVAGGIGITPMISLYKHYMLSGVPVQTLISSNDDFVFLEYFSAPRLFDTRKGPRICARDIPQDSLVYLCGPEPMINSLRDDLEKRGHPSNMIFSEDFK
ncbi:MAG: hypothetical protein KC535_04345 [Nanoarchaeota archaeon]|nr:hypothetical protein [Nanoarchaeota archaeon]